MQGARFWECDKSKHRGKPLDPDDGFFSQDASLFMISKVRVDKSTAEWSIKNNFSSVWNTLRL